jgi:hypothetical protein
MKKSLLTISLLAGATAGYAQGTINWADYIAPSKTGVGFSISVFGPAAPGDAPTSGLGNTANDTPAGTTTYAGAPLSGTAYEVGLYVGSTPAAAAAAVLSGSPIATTTFLTGSGAGNWEFAKALDATDPAGPSTVYVDIAAWSTGGGASSYAAAFSTPGDLFGSSGPSTSPVAEVGGSPPPTPNNLQGLGLGDFTIGSVPEPSTIALGVMGASAFLMRLRRK